MKKLNKPDFTNIAQAPVENQSTWVHINELYFSPTNPRKWYNEDSIKDLAKDILKNKLIHPVTVREKPQNTEGGKKYEVIAGSRRTRAKQLIFEMDPSDCYIPVILRNDLNDREAFELQFSENMHRDDVLPLDEAIAFDSYLNFTGENVEVLAHRVNHHPSYVYRRLKLLNLIDSGKVLLSKKVMPIGIAQIIARLDPDQQEKMLNWAVVTNDDKHQFTRTETQVKQYITDYIYLSLEKAPFDITADYDDIVPCVKCPKNTACNQFLFDDMKDKGLCTDKACYDNKTAMAADFAISDYIKTCKISKIEPIYVAHRHSSVPDEYKEKTRNFSEFQHVYHQPTEGAIPALVVTKGYDEYIQNSIIYVVPKKDFFEPKAKVEKEPTHVSLFYKERTQQLEQARALAEKIDVSKFGLDDERVLRLLFYTMYRHSHDTAFIKHYFKEVHKKHPLDLSYQKANWRDKAKENKKEYTEEYELAMITEYWNEWRTNKRTYSSEMETLINAIANHADITYIKKKVYESLQKSLELSPMPFVNLFQ